MGTANGEVGANGEDKEAASSRTAGEEQPKDTDELCTEDEAIPDGELGLLGTGQAPLPISENAFDIVTLGVDRRMLVNRQKQLKMYRCWMQGRFKKPYGTSVN